MWQSVWDGWEVIWNESGEVDSGECEEVQECVICGEIGECLVGTSVRSVGW